MQLDEQTMRIVHEKIAEAVLAQIGPETRDVILTKSVSNALKDYSFKNLIEKSVCDEASKHAEEMLREEEWQKKIAAVVREGLNTYLAKVSSAVDKALQEALFGTNETYGGRSLVLKYLGRIDEEKE